MVYKTLKRLIFACSLVAAPNYLCAQPTPVFEPPVMGWSSWNTYRVNISDSLIMKQADAMVDKGLKEVGFQYINIDDGFFGYRDEKGKMHVHPKRFPHGMKRVADYIHSKGLKAGIYSDAGSNTCGSFWNHDVGGIGAGLYGHERQDADLYFNDWGFDFIKLDYCGAGQELELEEEKRYTEIREAIDQVAGKHVSINICRWAFPGVWARKLARSWRISRDIHPNWESIKYIIDENLYLSAFAGEGHYNDMDMLEIGHGLKPEEEEVHFGMWCMMSSPLLIGCDMTAIPEFSLQLLKNKELIALNQDRLGLQAYVVQHVGETYAFVKDIEQKRGLMRAVALYNPADTTAHFSLPLNEVELGGKVQVRDLVRRADLKSIKDNLMMDVPAHSVRILRLEGQLRLEPTRYEAEWAYLPCFNDLAKQKRVVTHIPMQQASGGMKVGYLGGSKENYAEWKEVYSEEGGLYEMTIYYIPGKFRKLQVDVNHDKAVLFDQLEVEGKEDRIATVKLQVELKPGNNVVRMVSPYTWAPDLDCFTLKKLSE